MQIIPKEFRHHITAIFFSVLLVLASASSLFLLNIKHVMAAPLVTPFSQPTNNIVTIKASYEILFTTATTGTIKTITMAFPSGFGVFPILIERSGIGSGTLSVSANTITYTVTSPVSVVAGTPIRLEFAQIIQPTIPGTYLVTLTTKNMLGNTIDGPTSATTSITQIGTAAIANGAVTNAKLAANSVGSSNVAAAAIGTTQLANGAVTSPKIAASAVGTGQIANGAVTPANLASNSVTSSKIADSSVTQSKVSFVTFQKLSSGQDGFTDNGHSGFINITGIDLSEIKASSIVVANINAGSSDPNVQVAYGACQVFNRFNHGFSLYCPQVNGTPLPESAQLDFAVLNPP